MYYYMYCYCCIVVCYDVPIIFLLYSTSLKGVDFEERRCRFLHLWTQHYLVIFPSCENSIHFENLRNLMAIIFELRYGRLKYSHLEYLNSR